MELIKDRYKVMPIDSSLCKEWCKKKHYAHRIPPITYSFGLYKEGRIEGICTYGKPINFFLIKRALKGEFMDNFYELNRLCVNEGLEKNVLSYFVSQTFKLLPKPMVLVSYSDTSQGHHGYIYQATNWIYTGLSSEFSDPCIKGMEKMHHTSIEDMVGRSDKVGHKIEKRKILKQIYGEDYYEVERARKHRYFMFLGSKSQIKKMKDLLKYDVMPYPKGDNTRYDASYKITEQLELF